EPASKLAERGMIDRAVGREPFEIQPYMQGFFQGSARPDLDQDSVEQHAGKHAWMNGGLPEPPMIASFPGGPIDPAHNLIDKPNGMILGDHVIQAIRKQNQLVP